MGGRALCGARADALLVAAARRSPTCATIGTVTVVAGIVSWPSTGGASRRRLADRRLWHLIFRFPQLNPEKPLIFRPGNAPLPRVCSKSVLLTLS